MFFDEKVHTDVAIAFYRAMQAALPEAQVKPLFLRCVQQYGEERGRRMAMRALRMGYELNFNAYQACGEWMSTRPELSDSRAAEPVPGMSHTRNYHCLWCERFRERDASDVGRIYCSEIDRSIVRGFNPDMHFELRGFAHDGDCCDFVFGPCDPALQLARPDGGVKDFLFHCAHTYHSFCHTVEQCSAEAQEVIGRAYSLLWAWHGDEFFGGVEKYDYSDFTGIEPCK